MILIKLDLPLYRGASQSVNSSDVIAQLTKLRSKKEELEQLERDLDEQHNKMEQCLRNISEDTNNDQYPYTCFLVTSLVARPSFPFKSPVW